MYQGELLLFYFIFILFRGNAYSVISQLFLFFLHLCNMRNTFSSRRSDLPNILSNY